VRHEIEHSKPVEGSAVSKGAHLRQVEKTLGRKVHQRPACPEEMLYLWEWFCQVYNGTALTFTEIKHWSDLTHCNAQAWEASLLVELSRHTA
jgi:hypothetical protein